MYVGQWVCFGLVDVISIITLRDQLVFDIMFLYQLNLFKETYLQYY